MTTDIWIARIQTYRKWCIRVYFTLKKKEAFYREIYYDVLKEEWHYARGPETNLVDFKEIEEIAVPILESACFRLPKEISFQSLINQDDYFEFPLHPIYKPDRTKQ